MANTLGDFDASAVIYGKFTTVQSTGAPTTLAGTPALSVYKDNSTTQSTSGVTLTADFDSVTGLNHFTIDTSSDGAFYSAGSFFDIVITTGTVNSVSAVGYCVGQFTIRKTSALKPATAGRTLVVDGSGLADATTVKLGPSGSGTAQTARDIGASVLLSSGTGTGQLSLSSGTVTVGTNNDKIGYAISSSGLNAQTSWTVAITGNITGNLSGSVGSVSGAVGSVTGAVGSVTGNVGGNVTGSVGSVVGLTASNLDTTVSSRASASSLATAQTDLDTLTGADGATLATSQPNYAPAKDGAAMTLTSAYDAAKTAAQPGDQMDLVDVPNPTAVTAIQNGLATAADVPTANENADALLDRTDGVETNLTPRQSFRLTASALYSKASGLATTTAVYQDFNDTKARITATVDADGNRTAVTTDST